MFGTWHIICHLILVNLYGVVNLAFGTDASACELIQIRDHLEISSVGGGDRKINVVAAHLQIGKKPPSQGRKPKGERIGHPTSPYGFHMRECVRLQYPRGPHRHTHNKT